MKEDQLKQVIQSLIDSLFDCEVNTYKFLESIEVRSLVSKCGIYEATQARLEEVCLALNIARSTGCEDHEGCHGGPCLAGDNESDLFRYLKTKD